MPIKIFLKREDGKWDSVSSQVFERRKEIVDDSINPKYSGEWIMIDGETFSSNGDIEIDELLKILRFSNKKTPEHCYTPVVDEPEALKLVSRGTTKIIFVKSGEIFKKC